MRRIPGIASLISVLTASAVATASGPMPLAQQVQWPGVKTVWQHGSMYLASAPTADGLTHAKAQGVTTVINLMEPDENPAPFWPEQPNGQKHWIQYAMEYFFPDSKPWDEAQVTKDLGLRYEQIPIDVDQPDPAAVQRYLKIVQEVEAKQLLIHCDAAGRALAMWAIYLGTAQGYTPEAALAQAEQAGLDHDGLKNIVLSYLRQAQKVA